MYCQITVRETSKGRALADSSTWNAIQALSPISPITPDNSHAIADLASTERDAPLPKDHRSPAPSSCRDGRPQQPREQSRRKRPRRQFGLECFPSCPLSWRGRWRQALPPPVAHFEITSGPFWSERGQHRRHSLTRGSVKRYFQSEPDSPVLPPEGPFRNLHPPRLLSHLWTRLRVLSRWRIVLFFR
jgi:hypothetical protein